MKEQGIAGETCEAADYVNMETLPHPQKAAIFLACQEQNGMQELSTLRSKVSNFMSAVQNNTATQTNIGH